MKPPILRGFCIGFVLFCGSIFLLADGREGGRRSRLTPPEGAPFPAARGQVTLGSDSLTVQAEGLDPGEYSVLLDDGTGAKTAIGVLVLTLDDDGDGDEGDGDDENGDDDDDDGGGGSSSDDDDDDDDDDRAEGRLKFSAPDLPFGAASPLDLAGRAICITDMEANVVLAGMVPMPIVRENGERSGRCPLGRPDPAPDADAEGVIKLESDDGRLVIKIHIKNLEPETVYDLTITNPDGGASESLGMVTTSAEGNGQFKIDSEKGDAIPFGAGDLAALVGFVVTVTGPGDSVVLTGAICEPKVNGHDDDDDGDDDEDDDEDKRECEADLALPDPALDADARGKVELEAEEGGGGELEVEVKNLDPGAILDVVLTDPAEGGASETVGQITIGDEGKGELEIGEEEGLAIPFGKGSVAELAGFLVAVTNAEGAVVLQGTVPTLDCPRDEDGDDDDDDGDDDDDEGDDDDDDDEDGERNGADGGGGAVPADLLDGPLFLMLGDFDTPFYRGDVNGDEGIDISDPIYTLLFLFTGGPRPYCLDAADVNDDGSVDISDPIDELNYIFLGGRAPRLPGTLIPGSDPTPDGLHCEELPH